MMRKLKSILRTKTPSQSASRLVCRGEMNRTTIGTRESFSVAGDDDEDRKVKFNLYEFITRQLSPTIVASVLLVHVALAFVVTQFRVRNTFWIGSIGCWHRGSWDALPSFSLFARNKWEKTKNQTKVGVFTLPNFAFNPFAVAPTPSNWCAGKSEWVQRRACFSSSLISNLTNFSDSFK